MKKSGARFFGYLVAFALAFASIQCSGGGDDVTGGADLDRLVEGRESDLNFRLVFDKDMDTRFPPGVEVAGGWLSFLSPPEALANVQFKGCLFFDNVPAPVLLGKAVWTGSRELFISLDVTPPSGVRIGGLINRSGCSEDNKFRTLVPQLVQEQPFSFLFRRAETYDQVPEVLIFVTARIVPDN